MVHSILVMFLIMFGGFSIPLAAVLLRAWSKLRPRAVAVQFNDQPAFLYRLTEGLKSAGFTRTASSANPIVFDPPGFRKSLGLMPITVTLESPASAQITGAARYIAYVKRLFPGSRDRAYTGPSPAGKMIKGLVLVYGSVVLLFGVLLGGSYAYDLSTRDASGGSPRDVVQTIEISANEAREGIEMRNIKIEKTGRIQTIIVPPGTVNGARLRFRGKGMQGGFASAGDLYLVIDVK